MKLCLITDTHFGIKSDAKIFHTYKKKVLDNLILPEIYQRLDMRKLDKIVHLGDAWDRRTGVNFSTLNFAIDNFFEPLRNIPMDMIVGNHDTFYKNTNSLNSSSLLLSDFSNITIYSDATEVEDCLYVPWITQENYEETFKQINATDKKYVLGHLEITGYTMFRGAICEHGLNSELFNKFKMVMSGHFHTKNSKSNIHYLGCPWDLIFTDADDVKGIHFFDTETGQLECINNPYKIFNKYTYDDSSATMIEDVLLSEQTYEDIRDTFVKIYVKGKTNPVYFDRYCEKMNDASPASVNYIEEYQDTQQLEGVASLTEDTLNIIKKSIDDYADLIPQEENKKRLENLLSDLYIEALNCD